MYNNKKKFHRKSLNSRQIFILSLINVDNERISIGFSFEILLISFNSFFFVFETSRETKKRKRL